MKKLLIVCMVVLGTLHLNAQDGIQQSYAYGYHQHDGFYLSMNLGPIFGNISENVSPYNSSGNYKMDYSGPGSVIDFKIGGAIRENLILHFTFISSGMTGPTIVTSHVVNPTKVKTPDTFAMGEAMLYGIGMTRYFMPSNLFISGSMGLGKFSLMDSKDSNNNARSQGGFSMQLKMGKEWWVSKNWGLGVGLSYSRTQVNQDVVGEREELSSSRFGILFNTTFN